MSDTQNQPSETMAGAGNSEELANQRRIIDRYKRTLKDAVNELCYRCGQYKDEHLGACDGCRWRGMRSGEIG